MNENHLEKCQCGGHLSSRGEKMIFTSDFSDSCKQEENGVKHFKLLRECQKLRFLYPEKLSFKTES